MEKKIDRIILDKSNKEINDLFQYLFPICRSITGNGVRATLKKLNEVTYFEIKEIPSGTRCYDWTIPDEWNINDAYIEDSKGNRIIDFRQNNLHIVNYSIPVDTTLSFEDLKRHIHTLPALPNAIPYRTSYYTRDWGFCMSENQLQQFKNNEDYHVVIDTTLKPGHLTYGEYVKKGTSGKEFLFWTYCCHPSLANDNLSGIVLWALLLREIKSMESKHTYRFVIAPETIGAISYLSQHEQEMKDVYGGFVLTCVAGPGDFSYKQTFLQDHEIDRSVSRVFKVNNLKSIIYPFDANGSDERQFSSPFFRIPMGTICRNKYYEYDYYHTSLDNLDYVRPQNLIETLEIYLQIINILEVSQRFKSLNPWCEPMLGKRGLYPRSGGLIKQSVTDKNSHYERKYDFPSELISKGIELDAIRWLLFYGDGNHSLFDISEKTQIPIDILDRVALLLCQEGLLTKM